MSVSPALPALKRGIPVVPRALPTSSATVLFMVAIHALALLALLPRFWSPTALLLLLALYWLTACGTLSCQHGPIDWVGLHRHHHLHSDDPADHHNSHLGFWWSHFAWMLHAVPAKRYVRQLTPDLQQMPYYRWLNRNFLLLQLPLGLARRIRLAAPLYSSHSPSSS
jgi:stearoyl-CoA desaturase (delta-9 desaturase)